MLCLFVKRKTAYEMRISDWSSDVCSSDLDRDQPADRRRPPCNAALGRRGGDGRQPRPSPYYVCAAAPRHRAGTPARYSWHRARKSVEEEKSGSVRVDLGGRRFITKQKIHSTTIHSTRISSYSNPNT